MTPNELRALAVQLEASYYGKPARNAADYLRACADAKPVGYATANGMRMLQQDDATVLLYKHDYLIRPDHVPLYAHPAPAVPQAEPIDPHMIVAEDRFPDEQAEPKREPLSDSDADYWLRNRQAILDAIRREGFVLMSNACGFWLKRMDKVSEAHGIGGSDER